MSSTFKPGLIGHSITNDPLDKVMIALGVVGGLSAAGAAAGYGVPIAVGLGLLGSLAYYKAPARSFPTAESIADGVDLTGRVVIVTGPTSGIGIETARVLALKGAHVVLAARSETKLAATKAELEEKLAKVGVKAKLSAIKCDLSDLASVKEFVASFLALKTPGLHYLICNAGVMALRERRPTSQGLEQQVGINHVGHTYLTMLLLPTLKASSTPAAKSRVICLSSTAFRLAAPQFFSDANAGLETEPCT